MAISAPPRFPGTARSTHAAGALLVVLVSYFMIVLDNSIIFTALPRIESSMRLGPGGLAWVQDAYTLVFGGLLLLGGRLGDLFGRRRVFMVGLVLFGCASLLVGSAQGESWIISARAFQGIGAAIVAPSSLAIITAMFPAGPERTRATAAYGTTAGLGASLGLLVGGAVASWISWRVGFFINVPVAAVMVLAALRYLPAFDAERGSLDVPGAVTATLGMGAIVLGIIQTGTTGPARLSMLLGMVLLMLFVLQERRAGQPLMPLHLFASPERSGAAVARLLFAGAIIGYFFFTTQWFQGIHGWTPLRAGLGFLPMTVVQLLVSLGVRSLTVRFGTAALLVTGLTAVTVGMGWMALITPSSSYLAGAVGPLVLLGLGQGLAFGPLTAVGIVGVRAEDAGAASGIVNTAHQLGSSVGVAVLTAVGANRGALAGRVTSAYTTGTLLLAVALITILITVVPAERARHRHG